MAYPTTAAATVTEAKVSFRSTEAPDSATSTIIVTGTVTAAPTESPTAETFVTTSVAAMSMASGCHGLTSTKRGTAAAMSMAAQANQYKARYCPARILGVTGLTTASTVHSTAFIRTICTPATTQNPSFVEHLALAYWVYTMAIVEMRT
eukprot:CAMPEP_0204450532 /NCGR_PEP_ID=MMETSP0470-20130426/100395_1 /ASSEMBLY_ACC=CAM_ASM_000385 /TAXON_ID=2969 /ORGANISM="Oxyrrhis marina" /LENGTH=148 /DNA_ID=CAMNT_0051450367 /DNA_START=349 /DNA_END=795 /DNA_ORIENTATION=+